LDEVPLCEVSNIQLTNPPPCNGLQSIGLTLYKQRHKIENMFAKLKDWRRIATRYDRCAHTFMSAICIAATVIFWINQ